MTHEDRYTKKSSEEETDTFCETMHSSKDTHTRARTHRDTQKDWWLIPVVSRAQMQIYPNTSGTQAAAVWALCQSAKRRRSVPGTGEVTLFSYSASLIAVN